jgi:hypothetical protein
MGRYTRRAGSMAAAAALAGCEMFRGAFTNIP